LYRSITVNVAGSMTCTSCDFTFGTYTRVGTLASAGLSLSAVVSL